MRLKEPLTAHDFEEWTVSKTNPEIDDESARRNPMLTPQCLPTEVQRSSLLADPGIDHETGRCPLSLQCRHRYLR
jgi:hypothetical protein